jgi:hypothetical protein
MSYRLRAVLVILGLALLSSTPHVVAADPPKTDQLSVSDLSMEVEALRTLFYIKATPEQMKMLQKLSGETAQKARERKGKASAEYQKALQELHDALVNPMEGDALDRLDEKVDDLQESEDPDLEDDVEITAAARKRVPEVLKLLQQAQLDSYNEYVADDVKPPLETLAAALVEVRSLKGKELKARREEVAVEVARLVAGLDTDKEDKVQKAASDLLTKAHGLKEDAFKSQKADLEKKAKEIVGEIEAGQVLHHHLEMELAELLSNPRLAAALELRLK